MRFRATMLVHVPYAYTLVIGAAGHGFRVSGDNNLPDPLLMSMIGTCIEAGTNLPKLKGSIS